MSTKSDTEILCDNVRRRRTEMWMSVAELARQSGIPVKMLVDLDSGAIPSGK